jgi:CD2 antigen cytoplasmic tail-binding protein 2
MKEELAEGRFSADGSYVTNSIDPLASHDTWLNGLSKVQIKEAREAKERMDHKMREREKEEAMRGGEEQLTQLRDDCLIGLLSEVREGETVAGALNRLGRNKKRAEALSTAEGGGNASTSASESISRYTTKINRLTHFASTLLSSHGELEIYDQSHQDIIKTLKMEGAVRRDWVPPPTDSAEELETERREEVRWKEKEREEKASQTSRNRGGGGTSTSSEGRSRVVISRPTVAPTPQSTSKYWYRWNPAPEGQNPEEKYGPFERNELESWINQGYFGDIEASRILLRRDGDDQGEFKRWNEVK